MFRYAPKLLKLIRLAAVAGAAFGIVQAVMRCRKKPANESATATTWPSLTDTNGGTDASNASPPDGSSETETYDHSGLSVSQDAEQQIDAKVAVQTDNEEGNDTASSETESAASDNTAAASESDDASNDEADDNDGTNNDTKGSS